MWKFGGKMSSVEKIVRYDVKLPENCHDADREWLCSQFVLLPKAFRDRYAQKYSEHFTKAYETECNQLKKSGVARRKCNNWLRAVIREYQKRSNTEGCKEN